MIRRGLPWLLLGLGACSSAPEELIPEEPLTGAGLLSETTEHLRQAVVAPSAEVPAQQDGTVLVYRRGGDRFARLQVMRDEDLGVLRFVDTDTGLQTLHTFDLAEVGRDLPRQVTEEGVLDVPRSRYLPADPWVHFPLWVGKEWSFEFASHAPGREAGLVTIDYRCDARETVTTSAGTFDCLRVWRKARLSGDKGGRERTSVYWYAPELGFIVRRLDDSQLVELEAYATKNGSPSAESEPRVQE